MAVPAGVDEARGRMDEQAEPPERHKPAPDLTLLAMSRLGVRAERTVVVGDTRTDMKMGRAAGAATIQVLWGYERGAVPEADGTVATWDALVARILGR